MKILVTGATGFIGEYLLKHLSNEYPESEVSGTGRNPERAQKLIKEGFNIIIGDLNDIDFIKSSLSGFTHIVHNAARSSIWGKYEDFYRDNVLATRNLLKEVKELERFIYISTCNVYFNFKDRLGVKESDPLPSGYSYNYPLTKLMAEKEIFSFSERKVHTVSLRPRGVLGPGDTTTMPRLMKAYLADRVKTIGKGDNIVDFTSVKNLAHATVLSLKAGPITNGQAYNITDDETHSFWQSMKETMHAIGYDKDIKKVNYSLAMAFARASELLANLNGGIEPTLTRYAVGLMKLSFTVNIEKAKEELCYKPIISTHECIEEFIEWYKKGY